MPRFLTVGTGRYPFGEVEVEKKPSMKTGLSSQRPMRGEYEPPPGQPLSTYHGVLQKKNQKGQEND